MLGARNRTIGHRALLGLLFLSVATRASDFFTNEHNWIVDDDDECFFQLTGSIQDCDCTIDKVNDFNNKKIYPRLQSLLVRDYFRFYKVNLKNECPFWADDSKCAIRYCHVESCEDKDLPVGLKGDVSRMHNHESSVDKYKADMQQITGCDPKSLDHNAELGYLNKTISSENYKEFERWQQHDDALDNFCINESDSGEYVDLLLNPERYTGYRGESAHRIWRSIYMENCFRPEKSPQNFIQMSKMNGMCLEKRAFYRVISGLHASINVHLCSKYLLTTQDKLSVIAPTIKWGPNVQEFSHKFAPQYTGGEGPNWLKNLYFLYLLELRALAKAAPYLEREEYYTGNENEDADTRLAINDLLKTVKAFPHHFNESVMFNGGLQARLLKEEFRQHFRNISRIMDCVGCDKCKLWGKLQIQGLGTALKILFSGKFDDKSVSMINERGKRRFFLERTEIVALINSLGRLSESIFELNKFREMIR